MQEKQSKAPLVMMEQVIMVLVFALAAALCVQAFVKARSISVHLSEENHAMNVSQTLAETLKAYHGDLDAVCDRIGGEVKEDGIILYYDSDWNPASAEEEAGFEASFVQKDIGKLCSYGEITVSDAENGREISSMEVAWQEVEDE